MSIRWDALLARHVAASLDAALSGNRLRALRLDGEGRDLTLLFRERTLVWRLHPTRGVVLLRPAADPAPFDIRLAARVRRVHAPTDERAIRIELLPKGGSMSQDVVVELMGNQWNAVVTEGPSAVVRHVLWTRDSGRGHRVGARFVPAPPAGRAGSDGELGLDSWLELLLAVPADERERTLVRGVAWTSPINASALLGDDLPERSERDRLTAGYGRWRRVARMDVPEEAVVMELDRGPQPYGTALPGVPSRPAAGLLEAFAELAADDTDALGAPVPTLDPEVGRRLTEALDRAERRLSSLEGQLEALRREDPDTLRGLGNLLLARYGDIAQGSSSATLPGFDGTPVEVTLDPALTPHENASRFYDEASRVERARERLPAMVEEARAAVAHLRGLAAQARAGGIDVAELERMLPGEAGSRASDGGAPALPYRTFRSSGDLEIRVGRGARHNDDLTFHHAAPDDVWLHARHAAGAHVILRWPGPGNPPARDLEEAAVLAALHSKARTSGSVPVDWTLRKYVRKPRKAPPGSVSPDRVKTVFVRPDPAVAEALAER